MDHWLLLLLLWSSGLCYETPELDVVLLVDGSSSISPVDFRELKDLYADIVRSFNIGPVQIALVQFSDQPVVEWELNSYRSKEELLGAVSNLMHRGGGTMTGLALDFVLENCFQSRAGMRAGSKKIIMLFTDSESQDNVVAPVQRLRNASISLYTYGVNSDLQPQLTLMSTSYRRVNLGDIDRDVFVEVVVYEIISTMTYSIGPLQSQCRGARADILLLVDDSGSITYQDFRTMKFYSTTITEMFDVGPDQVQIALVLFSSSPHSMWSLNTFNTRADLRMAISQLHQMGGGTNIGKALHFSLKMVDTSFGSRADSQKILILFTDGESQDDVDSPSQQLKDAGVELFAVGMKDALESELRTIASNPDETHVYMAEPSWSPQDMFNNLCDGAIVSEPVRLVGGASRCVGTLQVRLGEWRPVYGSNWTLTSAAVVCRELDCGSAISTGLTNESSDRPAWKIRPDCLQAGSVLRECLSSGSSSSLLEITCSGSVRLLDGPSLCSGTLQLKSNQSGQWSSVYEGDFDRQNAEVVCRELGCRVPSVPRVVLYGRDCRSSVRNCSTRKVVGLTCLEPVRLVGGASRCVGTLQVRLGEWRPVYGSNWTLTSAAVVCRELDCGSAISTGLTNESSDRPAWMIRPDCLQAGSVLRECLSSGSSSSLLEITCSEPAIFMIRLVVLLLTLLLFIIFIHCSHKVARRHELGPQREFQRVQTASQ